MKRDVYDRIKSALKKLNASKDESFTSISVPWGNERCFSVECTRGEYDMEDESGEVIYDGKGSPLEFCVYYQVNGVDTDCCTLSFFLDQSDMDSLKEFVDMYRK